MIEEKEKEETEEGKGQKKGSGGRSAMQGVHHGSFSDESEERQKGEGKQKK